MSFSALNARSSSCGSAGWSSIWFTAGRIVVSSNSRRRAGSWKFDTPIARTRLSAYNCSNAFQVSTYLSRFSDCQWIRYRSTYSSPSVERLVSNAFSVLS